MVEPIEKVLADVLVHHLAAAEHDGELDLVALLEEGLDGMELRLEVMLADLGAKLHFFDLDDVVLAASIFIFLQALEFELAVVHDPGYRRLRLGRDLHKVHFPLDRESLCAVDRHHA